MLLVLAGIAVRVVHLILQANALPFLEHPILDAEMFHERAAEIAAGTGANAAPHYQAPGYSQLLGLLYTITGPKPLAAVVGQSLLGVCTLVLTALLGKCLFGGRTGIVAGCLLLGTGSLYFFEAKLLAATTAVFLATLCVYLLVIGFMGPHLGRRPVGGLVMFLAGLGAGVLAVVRANMLLFPLLLIVGVMIALRSSPARKLTLIFLSGTVVALAPTFVQNIAGGAVVPVATSGGFNFYLGNHSGADGVFGDIQGTRGTIRDQEAEADSLVRADLGRELPPGEESRYWFRRAFGEIAEDPGGWFRLLARKTFLVVNRQEETINGGLGLESDHIPILRGIFPFNVILVLALVGLILARREKKITPEALIPVLSLLIAVLGSGILFFVMSRLRLPALPVLCVLAAFSLVTLFRFWAEGTRRPVLVLGGAAVVFSALTWTSPLATARNPVWEANLLVAAGRAMTADGKDDRAGKAFELAIETSPLSSKPLVAQADRLVRLGDPSAAVSYLERAAVNAPDDFSIRNNLGILYFQLGSLDGCFREMEAASKLEPASGVPHMYLGHVLKQRNDPAAIEAYSRALNLNAKLQGAYTGLIEILIGERRYEEARARAAEAGAEDILLSPDLLRRIP